MEDETIRDKSKPLTEEMVLPKYNPRNLPTEIRHVLQRRPSSNPFSKFIGSIDLLKIPKHKNKYEKSQKHRDFSNSRAISGEIDVVRNLKLLKEESASYFEGAKLKESRVSGKKTIDRPNNISTKTTLQSVYNNQEWHDPSKKLMEKEKAYLYKYHNDKKKEQIIHNEVQFNTSHALNHTINETDIHHVLQSRPSENPFSKFIGSIDLFKIPTHKKRQYDNEVEFNTSDALNHTINETDVHHVLQRRPSENPFSKFIGSIDLFNIPMHKKKQDIQRGNLLMNATNVSSRTPIDQKHFITSFSPIEFGREIDFIKEKGIRDKTKVDYEQPDNADTKYRSVSPTEPSLIKKVITAGPPQILETKNIEVGKLHYKCYPESVDLVTFSEYQQEESGIATSVTTALSRTAVSFSEYHSNDAYILPFATTVLPVDKIPEIFNVYPITVKNYERNQPDEVSVEKSKTVSSPEPNFIVSIPHTKDRRKEEDIKAETIQEPQSLTENTGTPAEDTTNDTLKLESNEAINIIKFSEYQSKETELESSFTTETPVITITNTFIAPPRTLEFDGSKEIVRPVETLNMTLVESTNGSISATQKEQKHKDDRTQWLNYATIGKI